VKNKLFVGNLPYSVRDEELRAAFEKVGPVVSANVILERGTNRSKGFGFVEMENEEDAQKAIKQLNESELDGRKIIVNIARPREDR
jgi:cold-inducible RNA-binding protein